MVVSAESVPQGHPEIEAEPVGPVWLEGEGCLRLGLVEGVSSRQMTCGLVQEGVVGRYLT